MELDIYFATNNASTTGITAGYIRLFRKHALPDISRTRVKLKVMESWIFNVLFAALRITLASASLAKAHGPHTFKQDTQQVSVFL